MKISSMIVASLAVAGIAVAAVGAGYTLFGGAALVHPGNNSNTAVQLTSNGTVPFSGIDFGVSSSLTFGDIANLALDYNFTTGSCGLGSPRFQINVQTSGGVKNAFVYIGPPPNYNTCAANVWTSTGNLAMPASFVDTSQLGGTFYDTFANADVHFGSDPVVGIQVVADSGSQVVLIDNVEINGTTYTFEPTSADACKDGGWKNFTVAPVGPFKNQGDCVSYFATKGKNPANGN